MKNSSILFILALVAIGILLFKLNRTLGEHQEHYSAVPVNPTNNQLMSFAPAEQVAQLANIIESLGYECAAGKTVRYAGTMSDAVLMNPSNPYPFEKVSPSPADNGAAFWKVECADDSRYEVEIRPDGHKALLECPEFLLGCCWFPAPTAPKVLLCN